MESYCFIVKRLSIKNRAVTPVSQAWKRGWVDQIEMLGKPKAMRWQIIFLPKIQRPLLINKMESICFGCPSHLPILILTTPEPLYFLGQSTGTFRSRLSGGWRSAGCAWRRRCECGWAGASRPSSTWCGRWQNQSGTGGGHFSPGRSLAQGDEHLRKKITWRRMKNGGKCHAVSVTRWAPRATWADGKTQSSKCALSESRRDNRDKTFENFRTGFYSFLLPFRNGAS